MRCLTLASALRRQGAICGFLATPQVASVLDTFADAQIRRFPALTSPPPATVALAALVAREWGANAAVMDHYRTRRVEDSALRAAGTRLLVIDDLKREHDAYMVLDSNLERRPDNYPGVETLLGPEFALVRQEFTALRAQTLARRREAGPPRRVLISLGLTDMDGITGAVVNALLPVIGDLQMDVVVGAGAQSLEGLKSLAESDSRVHLHVNSQAMAALTAAADIAVGAGGSSLWERCCLGLPALTVVLAENQRQAAASLVRRGATEHLTAKEPGFATQLVAAFQKLVADPAGMAKMSEAASGLCDGLGADRVAARLLTAIIEHG